MLAPMMSLANSTASVTERHSTCKHHDMHKHGAYVYVCADAYCRCAHRMLSGVHACGVSVSMRALCVCCCCCCYQLQVRTLVSVDVTS